MIKQHLGDKVDDDRGHSEVGASGMARWSVCPGSVKLNRGLESTDTEYSKEGHFAHEVAAAALVDGNIVDRIPDDWDVSKRENFFDAVSTYVDTINEMREVCTPGAEEWIECRFELEHIDERCWGTADYALWEPKAKVLAVVDYKHGQGVPVEVFENKQLMYYVLGVLHEMNRGRKRKIRPKTIELGIVQPRYNHLDGPVRWWTISTDRMEKFELELKAALRRVYEPGAPLQAGRHCQFCEAARKNVCPAFKKKAVEVFEKLEPGKDPHDPRDMGHLLDWLPVAKQWIQRFEERAVRRAETSDDIPNWRRVPTRAQRQWDDDKLVRRRLIKVGYAPGEIEENRLLTPAQMEKKIGKAAFLKFCGQHVVKESSGFKLVPDENQPERLADAKRVFSIITKD